MAFDDLDDGSDDGERVLEGNGAGEFWGRSGEDLGGPALNGLGVGVPLDEGVDASLGDGADPGPLAGGQIAEPGMFGVEALDGGRRQPAGASLEALECLGAGVACHDATIRPRCGKPTN